MCNLILFLKGMVVGIANIIPGLSGGTMALVLGIYHQLISSLSYVLKVKKGHFINSFIWLFVVACGAIFGIYFFSYIIEWLLMFYSEPISYFFMGAILSSVPYIVKSESINLRCKSGIVWALILFILGLIFVALKQFILPDEVLNQSMVLLFFSAIVAASAMIVPGISGSLVFVLFGTYSVVIYAIKSLLISYLLVIGVGAVVGLLITSITLNYALKTHFNSTLMAVLGLMIGTMPGLYVGFSNTFLLLNIFGLSLGILIIWIPKILKK